jgi:exopolysaccharide biosynthesis polyprenyl glycosylphosphotransferase
VTATITEKVRSGSSLRIPAQRPAPRRATSPAHSHVSTWVGRLPAVVLAVDVLALVLTVFVAALGRYAWGIFPSASGEIAPRVLVMVPALTVAGVLAIALLGGYDKRAFGAGSDEYRRVLNAWLLTTGVIGIGCYLTRYPLPRGFFAILLLAGVPILLTGRVVVRRVVQRLRQAGALQHRVLIVGSDAHVDEVAEVLSRESWLGYDVIGALTPAAEVGRTRAGVPVIGRLDEVASKAQDAGVDVVFVAGGGVDSGAQLREIAWQLEHSSAQLVVAPSVTDVSAQRVRVRPVGGLPLIHLDKPRSAEAVRRAKRTFDATLSFFLLLCFSPVFLVAAIKIRDFDGGPVFFKQTRVGRDGETFQVWKFRTMVLDAEKRLAELHAQQGYDGGLFKMEDDPRITGPGQWLRRFSIDELPQLLNVLKGDMSLVGPRPPLEHEVAQYDDTMSRRLHVRPGMTGLWQVSGRSDLSWSEAIRLDLYYVDNWSMVQDLTILARTFGAVVGSRGAY